MRQTHHQSSSCASQNSLRMRESCNGGFATARRRTIEKNCRDDASVTSLGVPDGGGCTRGSRSRRRPASSASASSASSGTLLLILLATVQCCCAFNGAAAEAAAITLPYDGNDKGQQEPLSSSKKRKFTKADEVFPAVGGGDDATTAEDDEDASSRMRELTKRDAVGRRNLQDEDNLQEDNLQDTTTTTSAKPSAKPSAEPTPSTSVSLEDLLDDGDGEEAFSSDYFQYAPTQSPPKVSTLAPTDPPTVGPTATPIVAPTATITRSPTREPTEEPTSVPSTSTRPTAISALPSPMPSVVTSTEPSASASSPPSTTTAPTEIPSSQPTTTPSDSPSARPSPSPTTTPSLPPSSPPSLVPSISIPPSPFPTTYPSSTPSSQPTSTPSSSPTLSCHDLATYKSPINGLGCEQHANSDCNNWRHIGLTEEQVLVLHNECPVACGTDCVPYTLQPSTAPSTAPSSSPTRPLVEIIAFIEFYVHTVPGEMEGTTIETFENGLFQYFSEVIDDNLVDSEASEASTSTDLRAATLADQGMVGTNGNRRRNRKRTLRLTTTKTTPELDDGKKKAGFFFSQGRRHLPGSTNLKVKVIAEATSRVLDDAMLEAILLSSLEDGSTLSEYLTDDPFFDDATFSTTLSSDNVRQEADTEPKPPTAAIVVSSIGVIAIAGFLTGHYFFRQRYNKNNRTKAGAFFTFSPKASYDGTEEDADPESNFKSSGSIFSFEESPVHRNVPTGGKHLRSLLGSRSKNSNDATSTASRSDGASQASIPRAMEHDQKLVLSPPNSPENLLAGIPPMIVIDNIDKGEVDGLAAPAPPTTPRDGQGSTKSREVTTPDGSGLPIRRIEASQSLAKALASNQEKMSSPLTLADMITTVKSNEGDGYPSDEEGPKSPASRSLSPAAKKNESDSVASTPWRRDGLALERSHRKCYSHDEIDNVEPSDALDDLIRTEWSNLGIDSPTAKGGAEKKPDKGVIVIKSLLKKSQQKVAAMTKLQTPTTHELQAQEQGSNPSSEGSSNGSDGDSSNDSEGDSGIDGDIEESRNKVTTPTSRFFAKSIFTMAKFNSKRNDGKETDDEHPYDQEDILSGTVLQSNSISNVSAMSNSPLHGESVSIPPLDTSRMSSSPQATMRKLSLSPRKHKQPSPSVRRANSEGKRVSGGYLYTFEAPSSGKLGIIIHKTVVHTVKDYSPLFGMVEPGDKIIGIDDIETDNMSTGEVTKVLASKRTGKTKNSGMIRMSVMSQYEKAGYTSSGKKRERQREEVVYEKKIKSDGFTKQQTLAEQTHRSQPREPEQPQKSCASQTDRSTCSSESNEGNDNGLHLLGAIASLDDQSTDEEGFHLMAGGGSEESENISSRCSSESDEEEDAGMHILGAIASGDDHTDEGGFHLMAGGSEESSNSLVHLQFMTDHISPKIMSPPRSPHQ